MFNKIKLKYLIYSVLVIAVLTGSIYFGYREISLKNKLDSQQQAIGELQSYKDEQVRLVQEKIQQEEENKIIAEQNQTQQDVINKKQSCEDTKKYCSEEIASRKASLEDIKKQVKKDESNAKSRDEEYEKCKADDGVDKRSCIKGLLPFNLDEEKQNLADQGKGLTSLLSGQCLNYQAPCE